MIERITLTNWQNHRHLVLDLDQVTVLVGDNGSGKSAVIRALLWLFLNEWEGTAGTFISWDQNECEVSAVVEGHNLSRQRLQDSNKYTLDYQEYKAFGTSVPEPVQKLLGIVPDNFQSQHEPVFWISLGKSQVSRELNDLFCLSDVDTTLSSISSELRKVRSRKQVAKERLAEARREKKELQWVRGADLLLSKMEKIQVRLKEIENEQRRIKEQLQRRKELNRQKEEFEKKVAAGEEALEVGVLLFQLEARIEETKRVIEWEGELCQLERDQKVKEKKLAKAMEGRCPLCNRQ